ncbi:MAG: universal stress protein [Methanobacteriaceae archaeon]|nr:universal stress protein [Methanobacteriaceae archaeon]
MVKNLYKKILVPTDGSKYAEKSLNHALLIANASGAEVIALSVIENSFSLNLPTTDSLNDINELLHDETKQNLKNVDKIKEESGFDVNISYKIAEGSPAKAILKVVEEEDIDLVVIGSSGKTGFDKIIMGSVADKVVNNAKCSVLVIR